MFSMLHFPLPIGTKEFLVLLKSVSARARLGRNSTYVATLRKRRPPTKVIQKHTTFILFNCLPPHKFQKHGSMIIHAPSHYANDQGPTPTLQSKCVLVAKRPSHTHVLAFTTTVRIHPLNSDSRSHDFVPHAIAFSLKWSMRMVTSCSGGKRPSE